MDSRSKIQICFYQQEKITLETKNRSKIHVGIQSLWAEVSFPHTTLHSYQLDIVLIISENKQFENYNGIVYTTDVLSIFYVWTAFSFQFHKCFNGQYAYNDDKETSSSVSVVAILLKHLKHEFADSFFHLKSLMEWNNFLPVRFQLIDECVKYSDSRHGPVHKIHTWYYERSDYKMNEFQTQESLVSFLFFSCLFDDCYVLSGTVYYVKLFTLSTSLRIKV